jgi:hypothetical protein
MSRSRMRTTGALRACPRATCNGETRSMQALPRATHATAEPAACRRCPGPNMQALPGAKHATAGPAACRRCQGPHMQRRNPQRAGAAACPGSHMQRRDPQHAGTAACAAHRSAKERHCVALVYAVCTAGVLALIAFSGHCGVRQHGSPVSAQRTAYVSCALLRMQYCARVPCSVHIVSATISAG